MASRILCGLDIATNSGIAIMSPDEKVATQVFRASATLPKKKDPKTPADVWAADAEKSTAIDLQREGMVFRAWEDFLVSMIRENGITDVAVEQVIVSNNSRLETQIDTSAMFAGQAVRKLRKPMTNIGTIYRLYGMNAIAAGVCSRLGIPCHNVAQQTWRKDFLGDGKSKDAKQRAVNACRRLGIEVASVDAAEAVGVVWWLHRHLNPYGRKPGDLFDLPPAGVHRV